MGLKFRNHLLKKCTTRSFRIKARGVGLGLSKCIRYASEMGCKIALSENANVDGINFDICMK